jgi:hypothetical protein
LIDNIESTINGISDELFNDKNICNWELEAQIFHFLHSLDKWFINPAEYNEQQFFPAGKSEYSKDELLEYFFY